MDPEQMDDAKEQDIARLLQAVGKREQVPPDMKQRWEQSFRAELAPVIAKRKARSLYRWAGLCASLVAIAVVLTQLTPGPTPHAFEIRVVAISGSVQAAGKSISIGEHLAPGLIIQTGDQGHLSLEFGGDDLRLHKQSQVKLGTKGIEVLAGKIYASDESRKPVLPSIEVVTVHGRVVDIGTQFTVELTANRTVATVRRGQLEFDTSDGNFRLSTTALGAGRLVVDDRQQPEFSQVPATGEEWSWIYQSAPAYELEGSTAYEFLQWSTGETGYQLEFSDYSTEVYSHTTTLHGSIDALNPEQAIQSVMATTDMQAVLTDDGRLLVSVARRD